MNIKPCPFCGEYQNLDLSFHADNWTVYCGECFARGPSLDNQLKEQAIELWNNTELRGKE
ncbi:MAG: Lar family restriction alleviation protein [Thermodesulfobacteriota bacterium]